MNTIYMGYDHREDLAYRVAEHSIRARTDEADIKPLVHTDLEMLKRPIELKDGKLWCPISQAPMATLFAISRFCVPFLQREGFALFMDCDMILRADIAELFALAASRYAVQVVKHRHVPKDLKAWHRWYPEDQWIFVNGKLFESPDEVLWSVVDDPEDDHPEQMSKADLERAGIDLCDSGETYRIWDEFLQQVASDKYPLEWRKNISSELKMDGQTQSYYNRKNWSSVILWNCSHPANKNLTLEALNTWPGRDLHAFKWLKDDEIGELPREWNWLVDVTAGDPAEAKLLHYTLGGPWFPDWKGGSMDDAWKEELNRTTYRI